MRFVAKLTAGGCAGIFLWSRWWDTHERAVEFVGNWAALVGCICLGCLAATADDPPLLRWLRTAAIVVAVAVLTYGLLVIVTMNDCGRDCPPWWLITDSDPEAGDRDRPS